MKILIKDTGNVNLREYLIPQHFQEGCQKWMKITINYDLNTFFAQKVRDINIDPDVWTDSDDQTFPSSLFNAFMRAGEDE